MTDGGRRLLRLGLLAVILASVWGGKCSRQGPEFFGIVMVPGTGSLSGIVTLDGEEQEGVLVILTLSQNNTTVDTFVTDDDGRFTFLNLDPGDYTLSTTIEDADCEEVEAEVDADELTEVTLPCTIPTTGAVMGEVTVDATGAAGVAVELRMGGTILATTTTDPNGDYQFTEVAPGGKVVRITPPEGVTCPITERNVTIVAGETATANFDCTQPPPP
ncbi:MAG TPA: carboxypeptidase regulatory-like domain-containing protein [Gemmatimonadota bacterium]|jgi:hypothetical protein